MLLAMGRQTVMQESTDVLFRAIPTLCNPNLSRGKIVGIPGQRRPSKRGMPSSLRLRPRALAAQAVIPLGRDDVVGQERWAWCAIRTGTPNWLRCRPARPRRAAPTVKQVDAFEVDAFGWPTQRDWPQKSGDGSQPFFFWGEASAERPGPVGYRLRCWGATSRFRAGSRHPRGVAARCHWPSGAGLEVCWRKPPPARSGPRWSPPAAWAQGTGRARLRSGLA